MTPVHKRVKILPLQDPEAHAYLDSEAGKQTLRKVPYYILACSQIKLLALEFGCVCLQNLKEWHLMAQDGQ